MLVLACDGVWDVLADTEATKIVCDILARHADPEVTEAHTRLGMGRMAAPLALACSPPRCCSFSLQSGDRDITVSNPPWPH